MAMHAEQTPLGANGANVYYSMNLLYLQGLCEGMFMFSEFVTMQLFSENVTHGQESDIDGERAEEAEGDHRDGSWANERA